VGRLNIEMATKVLEEEGFAVRRLPWEASVASTFTSHRNREVLLQRHT